MDIKRLSFSVPKIRLPLSCATAFTVRAASTRTSALAASAQKFRSALLSQAANDDVFANAHLPLDEKAVRKLLQAQSHECKTIVGVSLLGEMLEANSRQTAIATTTTNLSGSSITHTLKMVLPDVEDVKKLFQKRRAANFRAAKPDVLADTLETFVADKLLTERETHVVRMAVWGQKTLEDAQREFSAGTMCIDMFVRAYRSTLNIAKDDGQFKVHRSGDGKDCVVVPFGNSMMMGVKDIVQALLHGFRVLTIVQPQAFSFFEGMQQDLTACGLPHGLLEVLPGIAPKADPEVLRYIMREVDRLQFSGDTAMLKKLIQQAYEQNNTKLEYAGDVGGAVNTILDEVFTNHGDEAIAALDQEELSNLPANQASANYIYAPSIERAVSFGAEQVASNIYCIGAPDDERKLCGAPKSAQKTLPETIFGSNTSNTFAVAGDHFGACTLQSILGPIQRRGKNWRDQEEAYAVYELDEVTDMLLDFLDPDQRTAFEKEISDLLELYTVFEPEVGLPRSGPPLVGGKGSSQLVTIKALRPMQKQLLIPQGMNLPQDIVKMAALHQMSPLREPPVHLHVMGVTGESALWLKDPLKTFLRVAERTLGWKIHKHKTMRDLESSISSAECPPFFFAVKDRHLVPKEMVSAVAANGGYLYTMPKDTLTLFRLLTTTQAWTVICTEAETAKAAEVLKSTWRSTLIEEPHEPPEIRKPFRRDDGIGGGFGAPSYFDDDDDDDWGELSTTTDSEFLTNSSDED